MADKQKTQTDSTLFQQAIAAEGATGHFADVVRSIYKQESGSGTNTTTSNAGAVGGAQIIPSTFASVADAGWDIKDPLQNLRAGIRYAKQGYDKSGGDAALTGAFYYGGPGGMDKAKRGIAVYDPRNPKAPSTLEYGAQIAGRIGTGTVQAPRKVAEAPADPQAYVDALFNSTAAPVPVAQPAPIVADTRMIVPTTETAVDATKQFAGVQALMAKEEKTRQDQPVFGLDRSSSLGAAYSNTMQGLFNWASGLEAPSRSVPDRTWMQSFHDEPLSKLAGYTEREQATLLDSVNQEDYNNRVFRIGETRDNDRTLSRVSTAGQLGLGVLAGAMDPVTWASGLGAAKLLGVAGVGSVALARAGRPAAAAWSSASENVLGNLGYTATQQLVFGEHKSVDDYALDAVVGLVPSVITSPLAYRAGKAAMVTQAAQDAAAKSLDTLNQAIKNVGENAPQEVLAAEVRRIEAGSIMDTHAALTSGPAPSDRLNIPNLDEAPATEAKADTGAKVSVGSREDTGLYGTPETLARRTKLFTEQPDLLQTYGITSTASEYAALGAGTHVDPTLRAEPLYKQLAETIEGYRKQMIPDVALHLTSGGNDMAKAGAAGTHAGLGSNVSVIGLRPGMDVNLVATHEVGHAIIAHRILRAQPEVLDGLVAHVKELQAAVGKPGNARVAALLRSPMSSIAARPGSVMQQAVSTGGVSKSLRQMWVEAFDNKGKGNAYADYASTFDEVGAEQFVKFVEARTFGKGPENFTVPQRVVMKIADMISQFLDLFRAAKKDGLLGADVRWEKFFTDILNDADLPAMVANAKNQATGIVSDMDLPAGPQKPSGKDLGPQPSRGNPADAALAHKYGADLMPQSTPRERAEYATVVSALKQAEAWDAANPTDPSRLKMLGNNKLFSTATPATVLASSEHPLARMVAGTVLEQTTGATGRRQTAAISAEMLKTGYVGDSITHYDTAYKLWGKEIGATFSEETFKGENRVRFNKLVMVERESRQRGVKTNPHPQVTKAADVMDAAFERARLDQVTTKTIGWARLPDTAVGYTPHRLAAGKMRDMSSTQLRVFTDVLTEQFRLLEGMDEPFAIELARTYLDHARVRANGGHDIPANIHDPAAADMVRGALEATGMDKDAVAAAMGRYAAGGPAHTKQRLHLDLTTKYPDGEGGTVQLMDLFETDQLGLLRNYARRVAGEVALAQQGIMGAQGLKIIRRALEFGAPGKKPSVAELQAFDQVAAEMLGLPFGNQLGKVGDRVLTANALAKLGGMVYPQVGETINMIWGVGLGNTLKFIGSVPRLWSEVRTLSKGGSVKNSVLGSVEQFGGGGEFGLEGYKMVTAYDSVDNAFQTYTHDSVTWFDRVLRSGADLQKMLSMHRMTQAIQVRGVAEQIIHKAVKYIREGTESQALKDMGFTEPVIAAIKADLPNMVVYDSMGRIKEFDITKAKDVQAATAFTQAVHRGAGQMIQRSYIGENGKWVHDGYLRILTQFKNYPLVAMEKQWARNRSNHGAAGAFGILLGSAAAVMPIYYARVAMNAIGREDKDEYLEKMLAPEMVARASLNYVGSAGMAGELTDLLTGATGIGQPAGGRTGANKSFVATAIPAVGFVDDIAKAAKEPIKAAIDPAHDYDPLTLVKILPLNRTPELIPLINGMRGD